ncbi:MAG: outer membrane protein assembly factor BamE (lipoprotein component of BamABCDE complex) [Planctomycetota bacterium]|jgi:outer membrane protein assembly factor BamE (lipoprotein component of BamABCDE complex)
MRAIHSLLLLALLPFAGCIIARQDVNEPLSAPLIKQLQPGTTTARQVVELLGGPNQVVQLGRRTAYLYEATSAKSAVVFTVVFNVGNSDTRQDRLWVFFDEADKLSHYGATYGTHRTQYAMPWENVHEASDNEARDAGREGVGQ